MTATASVSKAQRFTKKNPCPICGGGENDPRGEGKRCIGYLSGDGWPHCSREEHAGSIDQGNDGCFAHRPQGPCKCGTTHAADVRPFTNGAEILATYDYTDEHGALLFQVLRKAGKQFPQRRPDGLGGWTWNLNGTARVLYRLPNLANDDADRTVYVVEGEKDVEALERLGHLATCNPMGAGKWGAVAVSARHHLRGRDVVVIADADEPGRKHARDVEASLRDVVRSIRVVQCPAPHKDVSDLLAAGGRLDQVIDLKSENETESAPASLWVSRCSSVTPAWLTEQPPPREYLMRDTRTGRGAIPARGFGLLGAMGGGGKSFAGIQAAIALATATPWFGVFRPDRAAKSLIVSIEDPADEIRRRVYDVACHHGIADIPEGAIDIVDVHDVHVPLLTPDAQPTDLVRDLIAFIKGRGPYGLVYLDPIARIAGANIDADNTAATALVSVCEQISTAAGGFVLGAHHTSQAARQGDRRDATALRGATALGDGARLVLLLTVAEIELEDERLSEHLGEIVTITRAKANHVRRWEPIQLRRSEHGVLVPLDSFDEKVVQSTRRASSPEGRKETKRAEREAEIARLVDTAVAAVRGSDGINTRELRSAVMGRCAVGVDKAKMAIDIAIADRRIRREEAKGGHRHFVEVSRDA
jgi:5S rRNA maturation endonuclease (ribonuclease M5)